MHEDVAYILEKLPSMASNSQCLVEFRNSCHKIARLNYSEDIKSTGKLVFKLKETWIGNGYSVAEVLELLSLYGEEVKELEFQADYGSEETYKLLNISLSDKFGDELTEFCMFHIGEEGQPMFMN